MVDDGFEVSWISKIEWLRRLLNDQYLTGIPIIKELLQNADDAGATRLEIAIVPGLKQEVGGSGYNPLFDGPALMIVNDGRFTEDNAVSIRQLGVSNKPGEQGAIGRFGLGLKSVFHLCEAFCYLTSSNHSRLLNPWFGSGEHADWGRFDDEHREQMQSLIARVIGGDRWFCLWLPLRQQSHASTYRFIKRDFVLDECPDIAAALFPENTPSELAGMLPMLLTVRDIRIWNLMRSPEPEIVIHSSAGRRFDGMHDHTAETPLKGTLSLKFGSSPAIVSRFAGIEQQVKLSEMQSLSELHEDKHWPWNSGVRADGTYFEERVKAFPHGAACFHANAASPKGSVSGRWAVFLPIDSPLELKGSWQGTTDITLSLHGYFFVDGGRRHVNFGHENNPVDSEEALQGQWNRRLRDQVVLQLVIPALTNFVNDSECATIEIAQLTKAIQDSSFFREHRSSMCRAEQFVPRLTREGSKWVKVPSQPIFALPTPPKSLPGAAWEVFPGIEQRDECIVAAGQPFLANASSYTEWPAHLIPVLCNVPFDKVIDIPDALTYLVDTWRFVTQHSSVSGDHLDHLKDVIRQLFISVPLKQLIEKAEAIQGLVSCLRHSDCVAIPTPNNSQPAMNVLQGMCRERLSTIPVPDALTPGHYDPSGRLNFSDARALLHAMENTNAGPTPGTNFFLWRSKTACCVFSNVSEQRTALKDEFADRRWFPVALHAAGDAKGQLGTIRELMAASTHDVLFVGGRQKNPRATALQSALAARDVLVIEPQVAELLAPDYQPRHVRIDEVIDTISKKPSLSEPEQRAPLVRWILSECDDAALSTPRIRETVRYLLHHGPEDLTDQDTLLVEPDAVIEPVWSKLMEQIHNVGAATSRVVNTALASHINSSQRSILGLKPIGHGSIPDEIREVGVEHINCESLTEDDVRVLLRHPNDDDVLRGLAIHRVMGGATRIAIKGGCYWSDGTFSVRDSKLLEQLHLLQTSDDPVIAARQRQLWAAVWSPDSALALIAIQSKPSVHWSATLDAWLSLDDGIKSTRRSMVSGFAWLPTQDGNAAAPRDIVYWPEYEGPLEDLLPTHGNVVPASSIHFDVQRDDRWKALTKELLPSRVEALRMLGQAMSIQERFRIGPIPEDEFELSAFCRAFKDAVHVMPVCKVVNRIPGNWTDQASQFVRPLLDSIGSKRLVDILGWLSNVAQSADEPGAKGNARRVFLWYLRAAVCQSDFATEIFPRISLLNKRGRWRPPAELCVGALGVDGTNLLCDEQLAVLRNVVIGNDRARLAPHNTTGLNHQGNTQASEIAAEIDNGAGRIIELCRRLEHVAPPAAIGGLLCILGDHPRIVQVAQEYIGQVSPSTFRAKVDWNRGELPRGPFATIAEAIASHRYLIEVSSDRTIPVLNLVGQQFDALVQSDFSHLLLGRISLVAGADGLAKWTRRICFRDATSDQLAARDCNRLLFETAATILEDVFEQRERRVIEDMWSDLLKTDQIDVRIAIEYILDSAFTYLATVMGSDPTDQLAEIWRRWDKARRQKVEAEIAGQNRQSLLLEAESKAIRARDDLRQLLMEDEGTQREVLQAVRQKINKQFQYNVGSILFELFQNADDAVVELYDLHPDAADIPECSSWVAVHVSSESVRFLHWGRPINKFMSPVLDEATGRARGYDQDLEKMLMLARSDKANKAGRRHRTGKFGLGFKSVFLATDVPKILSGRLAFEVVGGFLPKRLDDADRQRMSVVCESLQPVPIGTSSEGTLIELELAPEATPASELACLFHRLVGYLLVFARQIKSCRLDVLDQRSEVIRWLPRSLFDEDTFQVGRISRLTDSDYPSEDLFVIKGARLAILFGLNESGFTPLHPEVPAVWVTAPTQEHLRVGFAINAPFDVDIGRASLVEASIHNQLLAEEMGRELAQRLDALYVRAESDNDWREMHDMLSLATSCDQYQFWDSLWQIAAANFQQKASNLKEVASELVWRVLWGGPEQGFSHFYAAKKALPSKLEIEGYRVLTRMSNITYLLTGCLDADQEVLTLVSRWKMFREKCRPGQLVSKSRVWDVLHSLYPDACDHSPAMIDLCTVLEWECELANTFDPIQAERIGQVVNHDLLSRLDELRGQSRVERNRITDVLHTFEFLGCDGLYHPAGELLVGVEFDERPAEERLRAAFAPDERVLSDGHTEYALRLFLVCRQQMTASLNDMVAWALSADTEAKRQGVRQYLHDGDHRLELAAHLRAKDLTNTWLADHQLFFDCGDTGGADDPISAAISALFGSSLQGQSDDSSEDDDDNGGDSPEIDDRPQLDAASILPNIWDWWSMEGDALVAEYEATLYPSDLFPSITADDPGDDLLARKSWLVLLIRGMLETMGRAQAEQHRAFLRLCNERGWLDHLAQLEHPSRAFLESVEAYIEDQRHITKIEYFHWLRQFLGLSTVACHLDVYSRAFLDIDRTDGTFPLDQVLRPRTNPLYDGTDMDAPPLDPALGIGACYVVRELVRNGVLHKNPHVYQYCFVPVKGVRDVLSRLGCQDLHPHSGEKWLRSAIMFRFIRDHFDGDLEKSTFQKGFDLPFYFISSRYDLQLRLLGDALY